MSEYFDSHCHLTAAAFSGDLEETLFRALESGVTRWVTIASNLEDAQEALALVRHRPGAWSTAGVHPHEAGEAPEDVIDQIRELASTQEKIIAIGETGLDFYYDNAPRDVQRRLFAAHLALGSELNLPVVVHARAADADIAEALRSMPPGTSGVLHCFTGGALAFQEALEANWYVSFSGIASFKSFEAVELLQAVPKDRLLIETDSPYLAPVPHRGKRNEPSYVQYVAQAVAYHLKSDPLEIARLTNENACRFYGVW